MITDDLFIRIQEGSFESYLNRETDALLLNNYYVEFEQLIKDKIAQLHSSPNNQSLINAINNMSIIKDKIYNRIKVIRGGNW